MATTYEAIATVTVGSGGANSIDFTSIPATYTDLVILASHRSTNSAGAGSNALTFTFNGSTSNRSYLWFYAGGTSVGNANNTNNMLGGIVPGTLVTSNTFANSSIYIPNYASSNNKSSSVDSVTENNSSTDNELDLIANLWSNTSAITQITLYVTGGTYNFAQYSTATLYGIKNS